MLVVIAEPILRFLHRRLHGPKACMIRLCADGMATILRSARCLELLWPIFDRIASLSGLLLKLRKCQVASLPPAPSAEDLAFLTECQRRASPTWHEFLMEPTGKYLGMYLGPQAVARSWEGPMRRYAERAREMVKSGMPVAAMQVLFTSQVHSFASPVSGRTPRSWTTRSGM